MKTFVVLLLGILVSVGASVLPEKLQATQYLKDIPIASRSIEGRITNGFPAEEGKVPYIVGLGFQDGWWCGGSIISNTFVLTAAHCTNGATAVTIYYGARLRTQAQFTHKVGKADFIQHTSWPNINGNDIALIRTPHVEFSRLVNKIELPRFSERSNTYANSWAVACGWGGTFDGSGVSNVLNCAELKVMENSECRKSYDINDGILCVATPGGKGTCGGDSGGPLVRKDDNRLVGVTSFVSGAGCQAGQPAGFTRVTVHLDWIRDKSGVAY